jgi:hypothetical protein
LHTSVVDLLNLPLPEFAELVRVANDINEQMKPPGG